jgi:iron(III) transport system ATP-binding protein
VTGQAIAVRNVTKGFGSHQALNGVTLEVMANESIAILGPSGCGKTTLLRLIAGLEVPDNGEIWLGDVRVGSPGRTLVPPHERQIGFVFQDLALWPHLTAAEHLRFVLDALRVPRPQQTQRIEDALRLVCIERFGGRYSHELSGGEQQRVALARALIGDPRLLLLDEPLSSLDTELRSAMRIELARLHRTLAVTTIYVTHDREDAAVLADRVIEMQSGRIITVGERREREERV